MKHKIVLFVLFLATTQGCVDFDLFGRSTKSISGSFELNQWEDNKTYYLLGPKDTDWGTLDGTVDKIGWNEEFIVVLQNDDGNGGGWRIVNSKENTISGYHDMNYIKSNFELKDISVYLASEAWEKL